MCVFGVWETFTTCFPFVTKQLHPHSTKQSYISVTDLAFYWLWEAVYIRLEIQRRGWRYPPERGNWEPWHKGSFANTVNSPPVLWEGGGGSPRAHFHVVWMLRFMSKTYANHACPLLLILLLCLFLSCGPFNCILFCKFSQKLSIFLLCSSSLISLPYWSFQLYVSLWKSS